MRFATSRARRSRSPDVAAGPSSVRILRLVRPRVTAGRGRQDRRHEVGQVDRLGAVQAAFSLGQGEEPVDEPFLVFGGRLDTFGHDPQRGGVGVRVGEAYVYQRPQPGQRGAQLVRGVGDESSLRVERGREPAQHFIEGVGQLFDLVPGSAQRDAFVEVALGQAVRRGGHGAERAQRPGRGEPADRGCQRGREGKRDGGLNDQLMQGHRPLVGDQFGFLAGAVHNPDVDGGYRRPQRSRRLDGPRWGEGVELLRQQAIELLRQQAVGDGDQRDAHDEEHAGVDGGQPQSHRGPGQRPAPGDEP